MPLSVGDKFGHYEVLAAIGAGGMGEVYRARDTKLKREVAIKVLPEAFARDPERMARFQREAEVLASLNHPNIATIHGVEDRALVMELVEGNSPKGPLPFDEAWKIVSQIAAALEYAHERGIMHRDLKPANILITPDGVVKLLDFGLAKAFSNQREPSASPENSPTLTLGATEVGVILGTAAYMAPEQARGKAVDKRADIWSFGVVLYELLAGERLFTGEDAAETLAAVIHKQPDLAQVPREARRLLDECLQKDPKQRLRDIGDAKRLLGGVLPVEHAVATTPSRFRLGWLWPGVAALVTVALAGLAFTHFRETPPEARLVRTTILPPDKTTFAFVANRGPLALSPDGRRMVFAASTEDGKSQLFMRPLDSITAQALAGTEGAQFPFWSPDSRFVGFFAGGKLKKIDTAGGPPLTLADAPNTRGGAWSAEGVIVFAGNSNGPLQRVSAAGGAIAPASKVDPSKGTNHRFPWFLPDGRYFLFASEKRTTGARLNLHLGSLDSLDSKIVGEGDSNAVYSDGHLLYQREDTLMAQPFDVKNLATAGEAVPVAEQVNRFLNPGTVGVFSVSATGLLAYQTGAGVEGLTLTWFDRSGKALGTVGKPATFRNIEFSPDRKSLAATLGVVATGDLDLWTYDVSRGLPTRFTFDPAPEDAGVWSPDGRTIVFDSRRKGLADLYRKAADGSGAEELLYADDDNKYPVSWSPDGKYLLYVRNPRQGGSDIFVLPLAPVRPGEPVKPFPFLKTAFNELRARFSPDGRWVAYQSDESGRLEIYVLPFPGPGGKRQISTGGGTHVRWRQDGKEIFYVSPTQQLMAAEVRASGNSLDVGTVRMLFGGVNNGGNYYYDVSADGQRILVAAAGEQKVGDPVTLVQNWAAALKK